MGELRRISLRKICVALVGLNSDPLKAYFLVLEKISSGVPGIGQYVSLQTSMGEKIVESWNAINKGLTWSALNSGSSYNLFIKLRTRPCSWKFWISCGYKDGNYVVAKVSSITLYQIDKSGISHPNLLYAQSAKTITGDDGYLWFGENKDLIENPTASYMQIKWTSGQVSIVPFADGYVTAAAGQAFIINFAEQDGWATFLTP